MGPSSGVQVRTRVEAPVRSRKMDAPQPKSKRLPSCGQLRSCVPQPSSAGCSDSPAKASLDHVFTNSSRALRIALSWLSRSAMWMTFTSSRRASSAHCPRVVGSAPSSPTSCARLSSACLVKCDTTPGLAPCMSTAVGPPG
jgi:hypothetical protein